MCAFWQPTSRRSPDRASPRCRIWRECLLSPVRAIRVQRGNRPQATLSRHPIRANQLPTQAARRQLEMRRLDLARYCNVKDVDEYLDAAGIRGAGRTPLFRSTIGKTGIITGYRSVSMSG